MNKNRLYIILFVLAFLCICVLGVLVVALSQKDREQRIYSAENVGVQRFITSPDAVVYVGFHNTPYEEKEVMDLDFLSELNALLSEGCYQSARTLSKNGKALPGDDVYYYIRYSLGDDRLYIHASTDTLVVSVNGEQKNYYTNITSKIQNMIVAQYKE